MSEQPRKLGRKLSGNNILMNVRVSEAMLERIDDWRRAQKDLPDRSEAVRRMIALATKDVVAT